MIRLFFALMLICFSQASQADWTSVNKVDDFTDKEVRYAEFNDAQHRIQLSHEGRTVWMFITRKGVGTFDPAGQVELRVDKNETRVVDPSQSKRLEKILGKPIFQWEPATVGFLLWHGLEEEACGYIDELLHGQEIKVRYQTNSLERETFTADLTGAKQAIIDGLELKKCGR